MSIGGTTRADAAGGPQRKVSVIVPVRNRRDLLAALLAGLQAQTYSNFETIVIDDGSNDGSDEVAARAVVAGLPVRLLRSDGKGAVAARRLGVTASRADILAFTDSDCVPTSTWLEAGVRAIDRGADMVNGSTRPSRPVGPLERSVESGEEGLYPTCNMFFRRAAYDGAGGFDEGAARRLGFRPGRRARGLGFGEDTLLAWKLRRTRPCVHAPEAVVEHHVFPADTGEWLQRNALIGAFPMLIREVPELRETLMLGPVLFFQYTRLPIYALAVAAAVRSRTLARVSLGVWVVLQLREYRAGGVPWGACAKALPPKLLIDAVSSASLVVGSARARLLAL